jgi:hypothetical protein
VQKGADIGLYTRIGDKFSSSVVLQNGNLFGARTIDDAGHAVVQWLEIGDPLGSPTVLATGVIQPPGLDAFNPSIAVNPLGEAVIGFTASGPNDYASAYAVAGILNGDTIDFGSPILLKRGEGPFADPQVSMPAWGDYSATTYDPTNPSDFWTIQEWAADPNVGDLHWTDQISELVFPSLAPTVTVSWIDSNGDWKTPSDWSPHIVPNNTPTKVFEVFLNRSGAYTVTISPGEAFKVDSLHITDPTANLLIQSGALRVAKGVINDGGIQLDGNSALTVGGGFTNNSGAALDLDTNSGDGGGKLSITGTLTNHGNVQAGPGNLALSAPTTVRLGGLTNVSGANFQLFGSPGHAAIANVTGAAKNSGTIGVTEGRMTFIGALTGTGTSNTLDIGNTGSVRLDNGATTGTMVDFLAGSPGVTGLLDLQKPLSFLGTIGGFGTGDTIDLLNTIATAVSYQGNASCSGGVLTVMNGVTTAAKLHLAGCYATFDFSLASDGHGGTSIGFV